MELEIKKLNVDANLFEKYRVSSPHAETAFKRRARLRQAIEILQAIEAVKQLRF
jgi:hypothetical protein